MAAPLDWREAAAAYFDAMSPEEAEEFRASALIALDEATRRRELASPELARLTVLADYLASRLSRREEDGSLSTREAILFGLLAGYQLAAGSSLG